MVILFVAAWTLCAQSPDLDVLFKKRKKVEAVDATALEAKILLEWSKSSSAAIDYLLTRARLAIDAQDYKGRPSTSECTPRSCVRIF